MKRARSRSSSKVRKVRKSTPSIVSVYRNPVSRVYAASNYAGTVAYSGVTAPDRTIVKMKYSQFNQLTAAVNPFAVQIYRGNSIFDPDQTGIGHQALGHDQWANLYEAYRVLSSSIIVYFTSQDSVDSQLVVICPSEESSTIDSGNPDTYCETPYSKHSYISVRGGQDKATLMSSMTTAQMLGIRRLDSGFDEAALFGNNPSAGASWFWHVYVATRTNQPNAEIHTTITYTVELLKRKQLTAS